MREKCNGNCLFKKYHALCFVWIFLGVVPFAVCDAHAECYSDNVDFDPDEGLSWNIMWTHCFSEIPDGYVHDSVEIEFSAQVWYWGWYPYVQDVLASNTNVFNYPEGFVCSINSATHPNPNNFYTVTCELQSNQVEWLQDDNCINFAMVTFGGTYYMDHSTLTTCGSVVVSRDCDLDKDGDCDGTDWALFSADWGKDCDDPLNECLCDLDDDNDCDGTDWFAFSEAWSNPPVSPLP